MHKIGGTLLGRALLSCGGIVPVFGLEADFRDYFTATEGWDVGLALVNQVACQVGGLDFGGLKFLGINGERVLVQDYQIGILAGL